MWINTTTIQFLTIGTLQNWCKCSWNYKHYSKFCFATKYHNVRFSTILRDDLKKNSKKEKKYSQKLIPLITHYQSLCPKGVNKYITNCYNGIFFLLLIFENVFGNGGESKVVTFYPNTKFEILLVVNSGKITQFFKQFLNFLNVH